MAERQEKDALEQSAETVGHIHGAVKTGKAIAQAAKGAAAGGPMGAAVMGVYAGRKTIIKAAAVIAALLALPVLLLLMLPSIIFGGLTEAPATGQATVLNDGAAISRNAADISFTLNSALQAGLDDVRARIEADFSASGADQMEVVDPYAGGLLFNGNLIVSQYCVSRPYAEVSMADLETILQAGKRHMFSFTRALEPRETTVSESVPDPETGELVQVQREVTELWAVYTIHYNGEDHFANEVFHLTGEQKALAQEYAKNLGTFLGDGTYQGTPGVIGPSYAGVVFSDGGREVVYYNQYDERFANEPYGTDTIGPYGCGPASMAIVVSTLTSETVDPIQMAAWSYDNGYWCSQSGSYHALIPAAAEHWGLSCEGATTAEGQKIVDALAEGKLVVAIMGPPTFTSSGHFLVMRAVTSDGGVLVADPASYSRSQKAWDLSIFLKEASKNAGAAGGPFWIIG